MHQGETVHVAGHTPLGAADGLIEIMDGGENVEVTPSELESLTRPAFVRTPPTSVTVKFFAHITARRASGRPLQTDVATWLQFGEFSGTAAGYLHTLPTLTRKGRDEMEDVPVHFLEVERVVLQRHQTFHEAQGKKTPPPSSPSSSPARKSRAPSRRKRAPPR